MMHDFYAIDNYPIDIEVSKKLFQEFIYDENLGKVFINETQYFENIPEAVWNLYIGNSQPAQRWLIDRKGKLLESNDIKQYQKTIATLIEINTIVKEINKIEIQ